MEKENKRHVQLPNNMTVTPQDLLIYLNIKRFMDNTTKEAFPSLEKISEKSGASIPTIRKCIKNLKDNGYISIRKDGRKNIYTFLKYDKFEPFSYEFLDKEDLTFTEKSYLVASQQYMFKENNLGKITYTNKELSDLINMSESVISRCNKSLEKKEYLSLIKTNSKDSITGVYVNEKIFYLDELGQAVIFVLQNHEDRIQNNSKEIEKLKQQIQSMQKDMQIILNENKSLKEKQESLLTI